MTMISSGGRRKNAQLVVANLEGRTKKKFIVKRYDVHLQVVTTFQTMAGELERRPMGDLVSAKDGGDGGHLPVGNVVKKAVELAAIPAFAMLVGAMQPFLSSKQPGRRVTFALQRFAGGLILSAVAGELYPPLTEAKGSVWELTCVLIGFTAGVAVMFLLKEYLEEDGEGEKGEKVDIQSGDDEEEVQIVEENFCFDNDGCVAIREADGVLPAGRVLRSPFHLSVRRPDSIMSENNEQLIVREIGERLSKRAYRLRVLPVSHSAARFFCQILWMRMTCHQDLRIQLSHFRCAISQLRRL